MKFKGHSKSFLSFKKCPDSRVCLLKSIIGLTFLRNESFTCNSLHLYMILYFLNNLFIILIYHKFKGTQFFSSKAVNMLKRRFFVEIKNLLKATYYFCGFN